MDSTTDEETTGGRCGGGPVVWLGYRGGICTLGGGCRGTALGILGVGGVDSLLGDRLMMADGGTAAGMSSMSSSSFT